MRLEVKARKTQERQGERQKAGVGGGLDGSFPLSIITNGTRTEVEYCRKSDGPDHSLLPGKKRLAIAGSFPSFPSFLLQCSASTTFLASPASGIRYKLNSGFYF
jgi:hypothetical protein